MTSARRSAKALDSWSRREVLALGAKALFGVGLLPMLGGRAFADEPAAARSTAKNVIYLYMAGGMSHLDTFDTKPGAAVQGPVTSLASSADGIQVSEYLPKVSKQMHHLAVIRSMNSNQGAHEPGQYFMHTSYAMRGTIRHPAMGAWVSHLSGRRNATLPANVAIGAGGQHAGAGYLESKHAPLPLGNPADGLQNSARPDGVTAKRFDRRLDLVDQFDASFRKQYDQKQVRAYKDLYDEAVQLMGSKDLAAFDISQESSDLRDAYGENPFGQGCLLARRLVEHDVRFIEVTLGGWDTHDDNFDRVSTQAGILDQALGTLLPDLDSRGLLEETLVVVATEFGRSPQINGNTGRDHHPKSFTCLLGGGGVRGGRVHGSSDVNGSDVATDKVSIPDFNATIGYALGLPLDKIVISPSGRPFTLADHGRPLLGLFA
ncbi:MAG: DUF1501 domain-containing protein [Planctomycetes bacterium]|nr:DUF1501 domain-containing protein [Planctomycetota bacterium]